MSKYVVVDLEMCKVPDDKRKTVFRWPTETIQIGAVLLDDDFEIIADYNKFVKPEYGFLDMKIIKLTGITSKELMNAPSFREAITDFVNWIPEGAPLVSWSDSDLKQIQHEAELKGIENERFSEIFDTWIDCQKTFSQKIADDKKYKLSEALIVTDINQEGQEHNGLVDAFNTAKLFAKMMTEPEMKLNSYFASAHSEEKKEISFSIADAFKNIKFDMI